MRFNHTLLVIAVLFVLISCKIETGIERIELSLDTLPFDRITLESSSDVRIIQSDAHRVVIQGRERDVDDIEVRVINDHLTIEENGNHPDDLLIQVFVPEISDLESTGSSIIFGESFFTQTRNMDIRLSGSGEIDFAIETDDLDIELTGSGYVYLEGDVQTLDVDLSGSGWVRSFSLESELTDVTIDGSGSAEVTVLTDLDVFISGSGDVFFKGHPSINAQITGTGSVIDAN